MSDSCYQFSPVVILSWYKAMKTKIYVFILFSLQRFLPKRCIYAFSKCPNVPVCNVTPDNYSKKIIIHWNIPPNKMWTVGCNQMCHTHNNAIDNYSRTLIDISYILDPKTKTLS